MDIILPRIVAVGIFNAQVTPKRTVTQNRKTTMFEIELPILEGGVSYVDNAHRKISCNMMICGKPGQIRHTKLPFRCYYIHMIVTKGQLYDMLLALPNFLDITESNYVKSLFVRMCELYDSGLAENEIMLQSLVLELVYYLKKNSTVPIAGTHGKKHHHEIIEGTLQYIHENLSSPLDLNQLAQRVSFSKIYFHNLFKASTGRTLHEYIEEQRIKKAVNLMTATEMTLSQIAYECGFSSQSYFCYAFKRNMGQTPRSYAKKIALLYHGEL